MLSDLAELVKSEEFRIGIAGEDFKEYGRQALNRLSEAAKNYPGWDPAPDNYEGVWFQKGDFWLMIRFLLHGQVPPVNIESDKGGGRGTFGLIAY